MKDLGVGVGESAGDPHGTISGLKTIGQNTWFKYSSGAVADGQHNRISPQAYYYACPFGILGEYTISSQEVLNKGITGRVRNEAWQVETSVLLTGEKNGYTGVRARNAFEPGRGFDHFGALELAFRYSQVNIGGAAFANKFASASSAGGSPAKRESASIGTSSLRETPDGLRAHRIPHGLWSKGSLPQ